MKKVNLIKYFTIYLVSGVITLTGCNKPVYEFGYDGQITGKIVDDNGNFVSGDIKTTTYAVQALGERDLVTMVMRINSDGTYANTKLYPQSYKVWLVGPFIGALTDTVIIDLNGGKVVVKDFQVTPLLTIPAPVVNENPTSTEIKVDYSITGNGGSSPNLREVYCSTVSWPTRTTGTGVGYFTKTTTVTANQGTTTITNLQPNTKYYIRVGARAAGQTLFNHSDQISATTAAN